MAQRHLSESLKGRGHESGPSCIKLVQVSKQAVSDIIASAWPPLHLPYVLKKEPARIHGRLWSVRCSMLSQPLLTHPPEVSCIDSPRYPHAERADKRDDGDTKANNEQHMGTLEADT